MNSYASIFICIPSSIGRYIRLERLRLGIRQQDLANSANVNQSYVSKVELDKYVPDYVVAAIQSALKELSSSGAENA